VTSPDLGCDLTWNDLHKVRPRVALRCQSATTACTPVCVAAGYVPSPTTPAGPRLCLARRVLEHLYPKFALTTAIRGADWRADLEVTGPGGVWRADVLASSLESVGRIAWEARLSSNTHDDTRYRTALS
jgi:competence protein CoiA